MDSTFVSVIIPNYNHARFLDERILSVLNQTYQNYELIILDDKSTDDSIQIINKYRDNSHVSHVLVNEENSGSPFLQWEKGMKLAKGELIWLAESDDSCTPIFLENLVSGYLKSNAALVFCRSEKIDLQGRVLPNPLQEELTSDLIMDGHSFIKKYLISSNSIQNASSVVFRRDIALSLKGEYTSYRGAGDWVFWLQICLKGKVCYLNKPLNYYRWHGSNTSIQEAKSGKQEIENKRVYDFMKNKGILNVKQYQDIRKEKLDFVLYGHVFDQNTKKMLLETWDSDFLTLSEVRAKRLIKRIKHLCGRILRRVNILD